MSKDLTRIAEEILWENFPSEQLTLDETVEVVNVAASIIVSRASVMERKADGNAFILWLGGLNPDIFVYGAQLLIKHHGANFRFDEKSHVRMQRIEDKFLNVQGYTADNFRDITHYAWPQEWADDSTFEDRLEALAEEFESDESPADMLLSGTGVPEDLDFNQRLQLAEDCVHSLGEMYAKYNKPTIITDERFNRFLNWLLTIEEEIAFYSIGSLCASGKFMFKPENIDQDRVFAERFSGVIDII